MDDVNIATGGLQVGTLLFDIHTKQVDKQGHVQMKILPSLDTEGALALLVFVNRLGQEACFSTADVVLFELKDSLLERSFLFLLQAPA